MLLLASIVAVLVDARGRYYAGGCSDEMYTASNPTPCKTKCQVDVVGRGKKRPLKWIMETENSYAAEITLKGKAYTKNKKPYIAMVRFDKKHCKAKILDAIASQHLRVDFGDQGDKNYFVDSVTYVKKGGAKQALMMQFRKKSVDGVPDLYNSKLKADRFYMTMSGFSPDYTSQFVSASGAPYEAAAFKKCFSKAFFLTMPNDGQANKGADYTKCALYNHYQLPIDWTEIAQTTTTTSMPDTTGTTTEGSTTQGGTTTLPVGDDDNLIPEGTKCNGNSISGGRIVGGDDAVPHSWPWAVRVRLGWSSCGGSILNENHVMCAAHCCDGKSASSTTITIGEHDTTTSDGERSVQALKITMHPKYGESDGYTYNYDFCVIKTEPMNLDGTNSDIVCLPKQGDHVLPTHDGQRLEGKHCYVGGWGTLSSGGSTPSVLQSVKIDIFSHDYCVQQSEYGSMFDPASEFCAGNMNGGQDSCQGDSGGPVICIDHQNQPIMYGVVSWGYGCAASGYPGIYAKVAAVVDWIENVVNQVETTAPPTTTAPPDQTQLLPEGTRCASGNQFYTGGSKIIGGETVVKNSWPWIAHMKFGGRLCSGAIINENHVITAGHCCTEVSSVSSITLKVAEHDSSTSDGERTVKVVAMHIHDKYFDSDSYTYNYDVCLLETENLGIDGSTVDVACLPAQGEHVNPTSGNRGPNVDPPNLKPNGKLTASNCFVAGWGSLELGGAYPDKLQSFKADVYSHNYCKSYSSYTTDWEEATEFCAGNMAGGQDACSGDAGAPLVCLDANNEPYLYGLATWGAGCAYENYPGIYAKVSSFIDWMANKIDPSFTTEPPTTQSTLPSSNLLPDGVKCNGNSISKIVNGDDAKKNSWPWIVGVRMGGYMCGGSIISKDWVLTAAHCCEGFSASSIYVIAGDHNNQQNDGEQRFDAIKVINHPKYGESDGYNYNYDICLLQVEEIPLDGTTMDIACLPAQGDHVGPTNSGERLAGSQCFVAGWGTVSSGGSLASTLQSVKVDIFSHDYCKANSNYGGSFDPASEFCAGKMTGGIDSCQGDSGGPLICLDEQNQPVLYGAVSWGQGCAWSGYPGIYAKVSAVVDWVNAQTGGGGGTTTQLPTQTSGTGGTVGTGSPATTPYPGEPTWETGAAHLTPGLTCSDPLSGVDARGYGGRYYGRRRRYAIKQNKKGGKIVGGSIVDRGTWSWIVRLNMGCGGSIIHPEYVITAAHCCEHRTASQISVGVGEWNRAGSDVGEFSVTPTKMWMHEKYGAVNGISYDVCLLKVPDLTTAQPESCKTAVNGGPCWTPVCMPKMNEHAAPGRHCWVGGWGTTSSGGSQSNKLRDVGINIMPGGYCESHGGYGTGGVNFESEFCAGIPDHNGDGDIDGGMDSCQGDSGGPVVCDDDGEPMLYGIVSWGIGCAGRNYPGVYAKTSAVRNWVEEKMAEP